jgi:hypothetical protein
MHPLANSAIIPAERRGMSLFMMDLSINQSNIRKTAANTKSGMNRGVSVPLRRVKWKRLTVNHLHKSEWSFLTTHFYVNL